MKKTLFLILFAAFVLKGQNIRIDSLQTATEIDTAIVNQISSEVKDSVKSKKFDVDDVITSTASDSIKFNLVNKRMYIFGSGELKYKQTNLKGGKININFETNELEAEGIIDSADTNAVNGLAQTPVLSEGAENYEGTKLKYNFKTQKGFISAAKNVKDDQRYEGSAVKKVDKDTYFVKEGIYTTCREDTPHTYFSAEEMKVIQKDKIFAKWIFMYIGGVPLPIPIPFAVFPNEKGRRSGMIAPTYGTIADRGQYFKNFGYFFAISDFMDLTLNGDYYTRGGWGTRMRYRYASRYEFSGNLNAGYSRILKGEDEDPNKTRTTDWNISFNHNQEFTPTLKFDANLRFQSQNYIQNNSTILNELLTQDITSNATLSKRWEESGNSLTINYSRTQKLDSVDIREVLPNVSFNKSQFYPFKTSASSKDEGWYEKIGISYSGKFRNNRNNIGGDLKIRGGMQHNISVNASPKIGYFNLSPRVNYVEKWYNKKTRRYIENVQDVSNSKLLLQMLASNTATNDVLTEDIHEINMIRTFNFGLSTSTKIYGMMQPQMLGVEAFRHTITPSVSYNYTPDFSKEKWGYYETYTQADGTIERYDPYSQEVFGGVSSGESQSVNFSVGNIFEMKTMKDPTDTTSEQEKITLLNLDLSTGYNFAADSLRLSDLRVSYRTKIGNILNFSGSSAYTFYDYDNSRRINEFLADKGKGLFRLTNLNFSVSASISGEKLKGEERTGKDEENKEEYDAFKKKDYTRLYEEEETDFSIPWNLSLNYNYNLSKPTPAEGKINSNIGVNLGFNLAKNWKFGVRGNYDFQREEFSAPQVTIYRDLECWEMNFSWNPLGTYTGFRFEIRMKAPELRDVKVTRRRGLYSGR
ncbi:MAG: LPS-assembly protein LptD [Ignavibacteriales bacterium]|nr:LPS-assembly protein LptD [Ignavibacteriales bacterium]